MNISFNFITIPITIFALCQCSILERATNAVSDSPQLTQVTNAPEYYPNSRTSGNLNQIAAKVNSRVVTKNELDFVFSPIKSQIDAQFPRKNSEYYSLIKKEKEKVFQELIDRELIIAEFEKSGGAIPEREIDREINSRIENLYNGSRSAYLTDLKKNGLSQSKYRSLVKRTVTVSAMKSQHITNFAPPTDSELNKEYSKFKSKLRDLSLDQAAYKKIWIPLESDELGSSPETQLELAEDITKRIRQGENFSDLAKEFSYDAYAEEGGQWPLTSRRDFPIHFAPIIFDAPVGKLIGPLKDEHGFHIIEVTKKINGPSPPLSAIRPQLEGRVRSNKSVERVNRWLKRLRANANIQRY